MLRVECSRWHRPLAVLDCRESPEVFPVDRFTHGKRSAVVPAVVVCRIVLSSGSVFVPRRFRWIGVHPMPSVVYTGPSVVVRLDCCSNRRRIGIEL